MINNNTNYEFLNDSNVTNYNNLNLNQLQCEFTEFLPSGDLEYLYKNKNNLKDVTFNDFALCTEEVSVDEINCLPLKKVINQTTNGQYYSNDNDQYFYETNENNYGNDSFIINDNTPYKKTNNKDFLMASDKPTTDIQIGKRSYKLWEFLRNLLLDHRTCPSLIKWDNYSEGTFKFVQSERVAQLWGQRKRNHKMNYEKFSRAMRYYYRSKVLLPVVGKRLVYKFGPQATGWQTNNPIL